MDTYRITSEFIKRWQSDIGNKFNIKLGWISSIGYRSKDSSILRLAEIMTSKNCLDGGVLYEVIRLRDHVIKILINLW